MSALLFDASWWLVGGLVVVGLALMLTGSRRRSKAMIGAGAACALVAVTLFALGQFVPTDRKACIQRTKGFLSSIDRRDWGAMKSYLAAGATLGHWEGAEQITETTKSLITQFDVHDISGSGLEAAADSGQVGVTLHVAAAVKDAGSVPTNWTFSWVKLNGEWKLQRLTFTGSPVGFVNDQISERVSGR